MKRMLVNLTALAMLIAVAGCDSTKAPGAARPDPLSEAQYPQVTAEGGLEGELTAGKPSIVPGPPMLVSVPVRLAGNREANVQYRFTFLDEQNQPMQPEAEWQYRRLPARAQVYLMGTAPDEGATDWRLRIRPAR